MSSFPSFLLRQCRKEKCLLRYSRAEKRLYTQWRLEVQKSKYSHFSKAVNPWFWSNNGQLSNLFFLGNIGQENDFYDILEWKNAFLGYKNKEFENSKNWHFSKGVSPWFWSKNGQFSNLFFLGNIGQENVFYNKLERKNAFLGYKKTRSSKVEILTFFQRG